MSFGQKMAALKETVDKTKKELLVGQSAKLVAASVLRKMEDDKELATVYIKRTRQQGWPGRFLADLGVRVEEILTASGTKMHFDPSASKEASQIMVTHGYGNPAFPGWREDHLGLVFAAPSLAAIAEVIELHPPATPTTKETALQAA